MWPGASSCRPATRGRPSGCASARPCCRPWSRRGTTSRSRPHRPARSSSQSWRCWSSPRTRPAR
eukprot:8925301-Pyramimonas_sp.AAC.1